MTRVVIVDDQQLLRRGLRMLLETVDIEVVGEAADGREGLAVVAHTTPQVVLCDARMPVMDGVEFVTECAAAHPQLPVIVLTTFDDEPLVHAALAAGAAGFLLKDCSPETLADAIGSVAAGGLVIDPRVARIALRPSRTGAGAGDRGGGGRDARDVHGEDVHGETARPDPLAALTPTERLVAAHVARGATNAEIAAHLVLAEGTVKNHVSALLRKLDARDRTGLALLLHQAADDDTDH